MFCKINYNKNFKSLFIWFNIKCIVCFKFLKLFSFYVNYEDWRYLYFVFILGIKKFYKDKLGKVFEEDRLVVV